MDLEDHSIELKDPIFSEEGREECELGAQINHTFSDGTTFQICALSLIGIRVSPTASRRRRTMLITAMAALRLNHGEYYGLRVYDYSSPLYKVEEYLLAYSESINVVPLESEWRMPQEFLDVNIIHLSWSPSSEERKENALRAWVRLSSRRGGTRVYCARDPNIREPLVTTTNRS
ncbi:hypothetical protein BC332_25759 [Capsicum chinense]|nr:hypothetical protein BC332_25759 [Capsicum chinense]